MADGIAITAGSGTTILTDDTGATGHAQVTKLAISADGSPTLIPADEGNGLDVDVTRVPTDPFGANADAASVSGSISAKLRQIATTGIPITSAPSTAVTNAGTFAVQGVGNVAHGAADSGSPLKVGCVAIAHGTNPTPVDAADRTDWYANRAGVPFFIGGHPNIVTVRHTVITTAVTNAAIVSASAGTKIVVTGFQVTLDNASTVFPSVLIGFATATTPTTTGVIGSHGGVPAGGGFGRGDGSGIIGIGADDEDLRVTTVGNATGNGLHIVVSYYTVPS